MKYLERRTKFEGLENDNITNSSLYGGVVAERNGCVPMDLALKEVQVKGPLVDRVAALESRLFQVKRILQVRLSINTDIDIDTEILYKKKSVLWFNFLVHHPLSNEANKRTIFR